MDRKKFLKNLGLSVVAAPMVTTSLISCSKDEDPVINPESNTCGVTKSDMLGPYYVSGTSKITNLNTQNLSGDKIIVSGKLYGGAGKTKPIANAMIEVWHADSGGTYHPVGDGNVSNYTADKITLRGFVNTDAQGNYSFESIRPGLYPGRPRHFHYRVTANGYKTLVTQIYFKDDPTTASESIEDCRIIDFKKDSAGTYKGNAEIHLESN
mgnify:CR=1 FL=1